MKSGDTNPMRMYGTFFVLATFCAKFSFLRLFWLLKNALNNIGAIVDMVV